MANFSRYQEITQKTRLIYIGQAELDEFKTKKLLGLKVIEVEAHPTNEVTNILDLAAEGVHTAELLIDQMNQTQKLRFKLK